MQATGASANVRLTCPLVSVQLGNHETGVLQPVAELAALCNRAGVPFHTDAVQVVGKLPVSFRALGVAAMSIAAHKFQGPPGIGALLLRDGVPLGAADVRRPSARRAAAGHRVRSPWPSAWPPLWSFGGRSNTNTPGD